MFVSITRLQPLFLLRRTLLGVLVSAALWLEGCAGSSATNFASESNIGTSVPVSSGRVLLSGPVPQAQVGFFDLTGKPLPLSLTTDDSGTFFFPRNGLPSDFRVVVTLPSNFPAGTLSAEVHDFNLDSREVIVNVPTTLAVAYRVKHPELSLLEAKEKIRTFLKLPSDFTLESLEESPRSPFLHQLFLDAASSKGGLTAFGLTLISEAEAGQTHSFVLAKGGATGLLKEVGLDMLKNFLVDEGTQAFGWVSNGLGIHFGFTTTLGSLSDQLSAITRQINELQNLIKDFKDQAAYDKATGDLRAAVVVPVESATATLQNVATANKNNPSLAPVPVGSFSADGSALLSGIASFKNDLILRTLFGYLTGDTSIAGVTSRLERLLVNVRLPEMGIDSDLGRYSGYGAFSNEVTQGQRNMLDYYLKFADLAANLVSENSHAPADASTLPTQIRTAEVTVAAVARQKKRVLQQLPEPLPCDHVFVDRENGLVWYTGNLGSSGRQRTQSDAAKFARSFAGVGPYTDSWRLPTTEECRALYRRIEAGADRKGVNKDKRALVLQRVGWDISYMTDSHRVWATTNTRISLDTGTHFDEIFDFVHNDVILVRSFPGAAERAAVSVPPLSDLSPVSLAVSQIGQMGQGQAVFLKASSDFEPRYGGEFTVGGRQFTKDYSPQSLVRGQDVTSQVAWSSSDESMASVSNFEGDEGTVFWHAQPSGRALQPVTVTADLNGLTATLTLKPPANLTPVLKSIQISPYNALFPLASPGSAIQRLFVATLFYEDPVSHDRVVQGFQEVGAPPITWTLTDSAGNAIPTSQGGFTTSTPNLLVINNSLKTVNLRVKAVAGSVTGQAPIQATVSLP